jgi:hypothetical protein
MQVGLVPWINSVMPGTNVDYTLPKDHILTHGECDPELAKSYKEQVTGISLG